MPSFSDHTPSNSVTLFLPSGADSAGFLTFTIKDDDGRTQQLLVPLTAASVRLIVVLAKAMAADANRPFEVQGWRTSEQTSLALDPVAPSEAQSIRVALCRLQMKIREAARLAGVLPPKFIERRRGFGARLASKLVIEPPQDDAP
jgi:hypothetical protein